MLLLLEVVVVLVNMAFPFPVVVGERYELCMDICKKTERSSLNPLGGEQSNISKILRC